MTEEQIKQKADDYIIKRQNHIKYFSGEAVKILLKNFAEEIVTDAIKDLQKENAELKARVEKQNADILFLKHLTEELEKENAELKADFIKSCKVKEQGFRESEQALERKDEQLTKAKELITRFVMASVYFNGKEADLVEEAEQFLSEVEK